MLYRKEKEGVKQDVAEVVSIKNVLLRGCILKNTKHVYGAVISAGEDTKVEFGAVKRKWWQVGVGACGWREVQNDGAKVAMLTQRTNNVIYCLIVALLVLCVIVPTPVDLNRRGRWGRTWCRR